MKKGYWIVSLDITNPESFAQYGAALGFVSQKYGGRYLARAGQHVVKEGSARSRNTIVEFESYAQALACYESKEYQAAQSHRVGAAELSFVIVEGL